jgi:hypothetical protein
MTVKIEDWKQNSVDTDLHTLVIAFEIPARNENVISRSMFRLHARSDAFDVQTGDQYVLVYGKADSLDDAKRRAREWLQSMAFNLGDRL